MNAERTYRVTAGFKEKLTIFYEQAGLAPPAGWDCLVVVRDGEEIAAAGLREGRVLTHLAAAQDRMGEGLSASVVSELVKEAAESGVYRLFLFTKPKNQQLFRALGFYPVAETPETVMMENQKNGLSGFLQGLPADRSGQAGCIVAHANPFTLGHLALVRQAAARCRQVYLFILAKETAPFSAAQRLEMAKKAVREFPNVTVLSGGDYLISAATFPDYFYPDRAAGRKANCRLDLTLFGEKIAPVMGIGTRFVGEEPVSAVTADYNRAMAEILPAMGVSVSVMPRAVQNGEVISASRVRQALAEGDWAAAAALVPARCHEIVKRKLKQREICKDQEG